MGMEVIMLGHEVLKVTLTNMTELHGQINGTDSVRTDIRPGDEGR